MERKIGEIFECNGEWYQCVESDSCGECSLFTTECGSGTKSDLADKVAGRCSKVRRTDNKHVSFKKLEKVGEPYVKRVSDGTFSKFQRYKVYDSVVLPKEPYIYCNFIDSTVEIEIKQNKEDMEEKKVKVSRENWDYLVDKLQYILADHLHGGESDEVIAEFENLLEIDNPEEKKLNLKPFDFQKAREGKPVCTRDGRKVRIICFDRKDVRPIVALIKSDNGDEGVYYYYADGLNLNNYPSVFDLMMLPEKKEGWVNLYKSSARSTKEEAMKYRNKCCNDYIDTIKISWEE